MSGYFSILYMQTDLLRPFKPCWWLKNPHFQTIVATWFKVPAIEGEQQRVELDDGDFIDLVWYGRSRKEQPLVLILHGLEGGEASHYVRSIVRSLDNAGFQVVFMYHRGCSPEHNRLSRSYHSGETGDLAEVLSFLEARNSAGVYAAVGYSLGANVLLKYLGEQGELAQIEKAIAISTPFELHAASQKLNRGFSRIYQYHLLKRLIWRYQSKFETRLSPLNVEPDRLKTFVDFDHQITSALNGFDGAIDYYTRSSSRQFIPDIRRNSLIVHAEDDPFLPATSIPGEAELPDFVKIERCSHGGHVGFLEGGLRPGRWLDHRILHFLQHG